MVRGIDIFRDYFKGFENNYIIIGGTACEFHEEQYAQVPRATKDIDIILNIEALSHNFVERFWSFVYYQLTSQQIRLLLPYRHTVRSITTDNGSEFCCHKMISKALASKGTPNPNIVFFTDSFSSWQKGAIENANKLIRQYIPKGTDFFLPYPVHSSAKFSIKSIEDLVKN